MSKNLLLFTAVLIITADYVKNRRPGSFPPGPRSFPIVGNLFSVDYSRTHESMTQLAGRYGEVYSLRMGQTWIVVLNGFKVMKEALVNQGDSLVDHPDLPLALDITNGLAKVQAEIDRVIGQSRQPSLEDRSNMPYTDTVIHKVQRMGNIAPLSLPHVTNRDIHLEGFTIPKGVSVIPNLTSVMFDKNEWETPNTFNPGRFLNEEGKFVKPAAFIPFSAGKRFCLGENLVKMELFLFFTSFMQHFTFSMPAGEKRVMDFRLGVTLAPVQYEICVTSR